MGKLLKQYFLVGAPEQFKLYTFASTRPAATKHGRVMTYIGEVPLSKSHIPLIMWLHDLTLHNRNFISAISHDYDYT